MWEHRSVSDKTFKLTQRILPSETYVKLMDEVEAVVADAEKHEPVTSDQHRPNS